jgi:hypothetical protein
MQRGVQTIARQFGEIGRDFYARGWVLGTSGNFSTLVSRKPFTMAITASAVSKGAITVNDVVLIQTEPRRPFSGVNRARRRADRRQALLHVTLARRGRFAYAFDPRARCCLTRTRGRGPDHLRLMLKGLERHTHEHAGGCRLENDQNRGASLVTGKGARTISAPTPFCCGSMGCIPGVTILRRQDVISRFSISVEASGRARTISGIRRRKPWH